MERYNFVEAHIISVHDSFFISKEKWGFFPQSLTKLIKSGDNLILILVDFGCTLLMVSLDMIIYFTVYWQTSLQHACLAYVLLEGLNRSHFPMSFCGKTYYCWSYTNYFNTHCYYENVHAYVKNLAFDKNSFFPTEELKFQNILIKFVE